MRSVMLGDVQDMEIVSDLEPCPPCVSQSSSRSVIKAFKTIFKRMGRLQKTEMVRENLLWWVRLVLSLPGQQEVGKWKGEPNTPYALQSKAEEKP